ncbi:MAG: nucleotidyltransferase [Cellulosilyticum sp.]|nr:nucleotidyltransferase [Cellulosilyticum sp.]
MEIAGIVAEYSPFHNGHLYQIQQTNFQTHCDAIVAVMSGNFSQRGQATITDKFTRTKMALLNGVDLVLELPVPIATASAEFFAQGAISIFEQSNVISLLSFGSECGNISLLNEIANIFTCEQDCIDILIKKYLKQGLSYPRARQQALIAHLDPKHTDTTHSLIEVLQSPNNILGIEYLKALKNFHSSIVPFTLKREGAHYHDSSISGSIASATAIRHSLYTGSNCYTSSMPLSASTLLDHDSLPSMEKLSAFLHFRLMFSKVEELYATWDIPGDLIHTFVKQIQTAPSYAELVNRCTSKTYTKSTVQRSLLRLLLELKSQDMFHPSSAIKVPYIRVLGCRKTKTQLLKALTQNACVPVITNLNKQYSTLTPIAKQWIDYEIKASKLYAYLTNQPQLATSDFTQPFIIL